MYKAYRCRRNRTAILWICTDEAARAYNQYNGTNQQYEYYTNNSVPDFQINATKAAFRNAGFLGIGTQTPTTAFTGLTIKSAANTFYGAYVDAGATGVTFYGYALNGVATAYTSYNSAANSFEYHQSGDAIADFLINGNTKAIFNTGFVGIGTATPTTVATSLTIKSATAGYHGMYIDAATGGQPFYGYAINGSADARTEFNNVTNNWELNYGGARMEVAPTGNVGIGTTSPAQKLDVAGTIHANNLNGVPLPLVPMRQVILFALPLMQI